MMKKVWIELKGLMSLLLGVFYDCYCLKWINKEVKDGNGILVKVEEVIFGIMKVLLVIEFFFLVVFF